MDLSNNIYKQVESCLKELSDIEYQKRIWLKGEGPEISTYSEVVCQLFDDTGIGDLLYEKQNEYVLSKELDPIFIKLKNLLNDIDYRIEISKILIHPNWPKVCEYAKQALELLNKSRNM